MDIDTSVRNAARRLLKNRLRLDLFSRQFENGGEGLVPVAEAMVDSAYTAWVQMVTTLPLTPSSEHLMTLLQEVLVEAVEDSELLIGVSDSPESWKATLLEVAENLDLKSYTQFPMAGHRF